MKKHISQGKFKRICAMPNTGLFIATKVSNKPSLSMWYNCVRVEGEQDVQVSLIARNKGFYYFQYTDWSGEEHYVRTGSLPSYLGVVMSLSRLIDKGNISITRPLSCSQVFSAKIELV